VLVKLIRIVITSHDKSLCSANKSPKGGAIRLRNDVGGNAISLSVPSSWQLASDKAAERHNLRNKDASTLLKLDKPFTGQLSPGAALVAMLEFELCGLFLGNFHRLKVVCKLNFLIKAFPLGVVTIEGLEP
jgi:hypothetical protein